MRWPGEDRVTVATVRIRRRVTTEIGQVDLRVPRDRNGSFDPVTVPKGQRRLDGLTGNVITLYAKGMTTGDIQAHLLEIYGTEISRGHDQSDHQLTDAVIEDMIAWQNRPLDRIYPVLLIDAIVVKIRDGQVANRPVYVAMGVNIDGERDVLGMWVGPSSGEGAKFWMSALTELRNRGIQDTFIVCCDGLKGLPESIRATWPLADVQLCVVHFGAFVAALHLQETLGAGLPGDARDLHRTHHRCCRGPLR